MISRVFFHLFPVIVAGTAMIMDLRNAKIDNGWILFSMFLGLMICIREKGISGVCFFVTGSSFPLFLIILFLFGMLGAGDIKLFCALGGVMGTGAVFRCILSSGSSFFCPVSDRYTQFLRKNPVFYHLYGEL